LMISVSRGEMVIEWVQVVMPCKHCRGLRYWVMTKRGHFHGVLVYNELMNTKVTRADKSYPHLLKSKVV
jgi:hypothetical protein